MVLSDLAPSSAFPTCYFCIKLATPCISWAQVQTHLSPRPKYFAYRSAQALTPPLFFINVVSRWRGFLTRATYRSALDHLLIVLWSSLCSHVERMITANGSALVSTRRPANLYARRMSFLVCRRPV